MVDRDVLGRRLAAAVAVCALALVGCADDEAPPPVAPEESPAGTPEQTPPGTPEQTPAAPSPTGGPTGQAAPPADSCIDLPEAPDGRYAVGDAGTAVVRRDGDRLVLEEVESAAGWTYDITEQDDDEVEIDFYRDGLKLELEVEIDDGQVEVEVCADHD